MTITYHGGNIIRGTAADRTGGTWTNLQSGYLFVESDTQLIYYWNGTAWTVTAPVEQYNYFVYKLGSTYYAKDGATLGIGLSGTTAETVIQYAIDNVTAGGTIAFKHAPNDWFVLTDGLNLVDKKVHLVGINDNFTSVAASGSNAWGGTVFKKNYAVAEPLFDMTNTSYNINSLSNMRIIGNSTSGDIGVKLYFGRKNIFNNVSVSGFGVGVQGHAWVDCDVYSLRVSDCLTTGLYFPAVSARINTTRFFGGSISSNPTNVYFDASTANDVHFFGTQFEGLNTGHVKSVQIESGANDIGFYGCSFEKNTETNPIIVYDGGNNNTYLKCRFDSDVSYTPIQFRSTAKNNTVQNCFFQTNTAATTSTILLDSGAINCALLDNTKSTNTVGTIAVTDNGTSTRIDGNESMGIVSNKKYFVALGGGRQPSTAALIYVPLFGNTSNINTNSTTESLVSLPIQFTFAPVKVSVKLTSANSFNGNIVVTFRDDAADVTNSTVTIASTDTAAGTLKESTGTMGVIASGSLCAWKVDATAASTGTGPILTMAIQGYAY